MEQQSDEFSGSGESDDKKDLIGGTVDEEGILEYDDSNASSFEGGNKSNSFPLTLLFNNFL